MRFSLIYDGVKIREKATKKLKESKGPFGEPFHLKKGKIKLFECFASYYHKDVEERDDGTLKRFRRASIDAEWLERSQTVEIFVVGRPESNPTRTYWDQYWGYGNAFERNEFEVAEVDTSIFDAD